MKYGFIGCGNMGGAIARALSTSTKDIMLANRTAAKAEALAAELGVKSGTNEAVANDCDIIFLAVKPQMAEEALIPIKGILEARRPLIISMLAGVNISRIESLISGSVRLPVIRILPNTPVAVGKGVIVYAHNDLVCETAMADFLKDMDCAGMLDEIPEKMIDAAGAISGCGPAFMYMFINALADGGVECGIPRAKAIKYAEMTMAGSAELALMSDKHPEQLKDEVCSPGGSTIVGVHTLEAKGFRDAAASAICDAYRKTCELGK